MPMPPHQDFDPNFEPPNQNFDPNYDPTVLYEDDSAALGDIGEKVILKMRPDGTHYEVKHINTIGTAQQCESIFTHE
jgi:hypothetical protein